MNKQRRKELERIADLLSECMSGLESVKEEEQEAYDNLPEGIQYSERGEAMQENVDDLDFKKAMTQQRNFFLIRRPV